MDSCVYFCIAESNCPFPKDVHIKHLTDLFNVVVRSSTLAICFQMGRWQDNFTYLPHNFKDTNYFASPHECLTLAEAGLTMLLLVTLNLTNWAPLNHTLVVAFTSW